MEDFFKSRLDDPENRQIWHETTGSAHSTKLTSHK